MTVILHVARLLVDCLIAAVATGLIIWAYRYARELLECQRWRDVLPVDPVETQLWEVLAEARRITEDGDHAAG